MRTIRKFHDLGPNTGADKRRGSLLLLILAAAIAVSAGVLFVVRAHNIAKPGAGSSATPASKITTKPIQAPAREVVRFVRFNLYDQAIIPREVHVTEGLVAISIEEYSGGTSGLVVERMSGNGSQQIGTVQLNGPEWRGQSEIRLVAGSYIVHMANRSDNRALLVVDPDSQKR
jgi:hypothetical protein